MREGTNMWRSSGFCSLSSTVCLLFFRDRGATHSLPYWAPMSVGCVTRHLHTRSHLANHRCIVKGKGDNTQTDWTNIQHVLIFSLFFFTAENLSVPLSVSHNPNTPPSLLVGPPFPTYTYGQVGQISLLRLCVGESVMTSLHWVEFRFRVPPPPAEAEPVESRCSAISSEMKVFRSTSWRPLRLLRQVGTALGELPPPAPPPPPLPLLLLPLTCVGDPGAPERTLMLAMAPLRPVEGSKTQMRSRNLSFVQIHLSQHRMFNHSGFYWNSFCTVAVVTSNSLPQQ